MATWWLPGFPGLAKFVSWEATSSLHAHSEVCFGADRPPCAALFWPSMDELVQPIRPPGQETQGPWLDPSPGREEGTGRVVGLTFGDVTPGNMAAAGVPRLGQVRLLGSNHQSSHPLGSLLRGGWTPTLGPFRNKRGRAGTANPIPGPGMLGSWPDTSPRWEEGPGRGAGLTFGV